MLESVTAIKYVFMVRLLGFSGNRKHAYIQSKQLSYKVYQGANICSSSNFTGGQVWNLTGTRNHSFW